MAAPFQITDEIRGVYRDGIDAIIDQLGQDCKLILDGPSTPCPNCYFDQASSRSSGLYNTTGPLPFSHGVCPVCHGTGYDPLTTVITEIRRFSVRKNLKPSVYLPPGLYDRPVTLAKIKGMMTDITLVMQAKYIVLDYKNAEYSNERFVKLNDPQFVGNIVSGRYFTCLLKKVE